MSGCWLVGLLLMAAGGAWAEDAAPVIRLSDPYCITRGFARVSTIPTGTYDAATLTASLVPAGLATLAVRVIDAGHLELTLQALEPGNGFLQLQGPQQREVARTRVQVVSLASTATKSISRDRELADGRLVFGMWLVMRPYVPGLDVHLTCTGDHNSIPDGLREQWAATETCQQAPALGLGRLRFRMVREAAGEWVPYTISLYQDGEEVGAR
jgi:hypothetical protein